MPAAGFPVSTPLGAHRVPRKLLGQWTLMPLGPRLRTSTGGLVYLSRSPPPVPCVTCGLPLPASQEECACGKDNRYETSFWEVSEAVETAWEELDGVTH